MLQAFFKTSWKTTCLGALYFCWEIYHEVLASLAGQAINKRNVGAAVFVALMGYVARDWNKSSEDEGLKPNSVDLKAVQDLVSGVIVGGPKVLLPFILAASLCCASSQAMLNATVEKEAVHVDKEAVVVSPEAVKVIGTVSGSGIIHPGAMQVRGEIENGAFQAPLATLKIDAPVNLSAPKDCVHVEIPVTLSTSADTLHFVVNVNVPKDAFHFEVHAENATAAITEPMKNLEQGIQSVAKHGEQTLIYMGVAFVLSAIGAWAIVAHLKNHVKTQLEKLP